MAVGNKIMLCDINTFLCLVDAYVAKISHVKQTPKLLNKCVHCSAVRLFNERFIVMFIFMLVKVSLFPSTYSLIVLVLLINALNVNVLIEEFCIERSVMRFI